MIFFKINYHIFAGPSFSTKLLTLYQGFSNFFCTWPTKLVRNGVGPLTFNGKHQVSTTQ